MWLLVWGECTHPQGVIPPFTSSSCSNFQSVSQPNYGLRDAFDHFLSRAYLSHSLVPRDCCQIGLQRRGPQSLPAPRMGRSISPGPAHDRGDSSGAVPVPGSRSGRAPCPGCVPWRDPGREGVPASPCPGPGTGRGPGEGRGDSRFADITAVLERPGASSPGGQQPRRHGHCAPAAPGTGASGKWRIMAGWLLEDPKEPRASSQHSSSTPSACTPDVRSQRATSQFPRTLSLAPYIHRGMEPYSVQTGEGRAGGGLRHWDPLPLSTPGAPGGLW